jgi:hypothetical protein
MTQVEKKILNELTFTVVNETNDQKAKRIADALRNYLESAFNAGVDMISYEWRLIEAMSPQEDPGYKIFQEWADNENII